MWRLIAALVSLAPALGCDGGEYRVVVAFDPPSLARDVQRVEVAVVVSCAAQDPDGADPTGAIREIAITRMGATGSIGSLPAGAYGLYARGRDDECGVVAAGCEDVLLEEGGEGDLVVTARAVGGPGCPAGTTCSAGACAGGDAGDGGADGGRTPDAGTDAGPPPCECVACATCTAEGACTPDHSACAADEYCDLTAGCTRSTECTADADCPDDGDPCTDARCDATRDPAVCVADPVVSAACCDGCWDGAACNAGTTDAACGSGGASCAACDATACPPTSCSGTCVAPGAVHVDLRSVHACAVARDRSLWCWGENGDDQLGLGGGPDRLRPERVGTDTNWSVVGAGERHTCAVKTDGSLWCWGDNDDRQLGSPSPPSASTPIQVGTEMTWAMVDGGDDDACAVRTDGSLWCWGRFRPGGAAPLTHVADDFATIAVRGRHRCGIETDGSLWCFGSNYSGELGIGRLTIPQSSPQRVGSRSDWAVVTVGGPAGSDGFSCAVPTNGTLWCWGDNQYGQLGDGGRLDSSSPRQVGSDTDWARVHAGAQHVCAVKTGGSLWCWGNAADGRLGPGSGPPDEPRRVGTETGWTDVRAGSVSTCALRDATGGSIWCFGGNQSGEAGDDTPARTGVPAPSPACL